MKTSLTIALMVIATITMAQKQIDFGRKTVGKGIFFDIVASVNQPSMGMQTVTYRFGNTSSKTVWLVWVTTLTLSNGRTITSKHSYKFGPGETKDMGWGGEGDIVDIKKHGGTVSNVRIESLDVTTNDERNEQSALQRSREQQALAQEQQQEKQRQSAQQQQELVLRQQQIENQRRQDETNRQQQELALRQQATQERYNQQLAAVEQQRMQTEKTIDAVGDLTQQLMSIEVDEIEKSDDLFLFEGGINSLTSPWLVSSLTKSLGKSPLAYRVDITWLKRTGLSFNLSFGGLKQEHDRFLMKAIANNGRSTLYTGAITGALLCTQLSVGKDLRSANNQFHFYLGPNLNINTVMEHSFTYGNNEYQEETIKESYWGYGFQFRLRYFLGDKIALSTGWEYNTFFKTPNIVAPYKTHGYGSYNAGLGIRF